MTSRLVRASLRGMECPACHVPLVGARSEIAGADMECPCCERVFDCSQLEETGFLVEHEYVLVGSGTG